MYWDNDYTNLSLWDVLGGLFVASQVVHDRRRPGVMHIYGHLLVPAEKAYEQLRQRLQSYDYTPMLREDKGWHVLTLVPGALLAPSPRKVWVNALLLFLTAITTTFSGALIAGGNPLHHPVEIWKGLPFSASLLAVLGIHELGHYFMGKVHKVAVTLPYFIPVPFGLGTFGAFIQMRSPVVNRKQLFDVGVAGPIAGSVVAIPLFAIGLHYSSLVRLNEMTGGEGLRLGSSLLVKAMTYLFGPSMSKGYDVFLHPVALAAWFGLFVTALNLLPIGQLDGGHVAYALFGSDISVKLAYAVFTALILGGIFFWEGWTMWGLLVLILGLRHPPLLDEITPLDRKRQWVGALAILLFIVTLPLKPMW